MQVLKAGERVHLSITSQENTSREIVLQEKAELVLHYHIADMQHWQETCVIRLAGPKAKVTIRGILSGRDKAELGYFLTVEHNADATESDIEFRGVAQDKSHLQFDGLIKVAAHAVGVIANEQNRNLLLSDSAVIDTRPRLEIDSNEVICRHGATVGDLDEGQLFYLMSRGIPEHEARSLLIDAFLNFFVEEEAA